MKCPTMPAGLYSILVVVISFVVIVLFDFTWDFIRDKKWRKEKHCCANCIYYDGEECFIWNKKIFSLNPLIYQPDEHDNKGLIYDHCCKDWR